MSHEPMPFQSVPQSEVPKGREGKHKKLITQLLREIEALPAGAALKVPLAALLDPKENIRSALSRAAAQQKLHIATASDAEALFVWRVVEEGA